jgi:hypothetical protein
MLRAIFGEGVHRGSQSRGGEECDVEGTPLFVECKHGTQTNPRAALRQCADVQEMTGDARPPVVMAKDDKPPPGWRIGRPLSPPIAVMLLSDWLFLVGDWARLKAAAGEPLTLKRGNRSRT